MAYNLEYGEVLLDHYENPRNAGEMADPDGEATVENPACGDILRLSLRIAGGTITEARFKSQGCPAAIAAGSVTTVLLRGMSLEEAAGVTNEEVARRLGGLPPAKVHCSVLAEQAVRAAIGSYRDAPRSGAEGAGRGRQMQEKNGSQTR